MIILHAFGTGVGLLEIGPRIAETRIRRKSVHRKQRAGQPGDPRPHLPYIARGLVALGCALAWALERMIEHHVARALAGARWVKGKPLAIGASLQRAHYSVFH